MEFLIHTSTNNPNPLLDNVFPFQTTCHSLENMILCLRYIHIHISPHAQPLDKEMMLQGMTRSLKWENISMQCIWYIMVHKSTIKACEILHFTVPSAILNSIKFVHGTEAGVEWFRVDTK